MAVAIRHRLAEAWISKQPELLFAAIVHDLPEATFAPTAGRKLVMPRGPREAKGLLVASIRDDNPVIYTLDVGAMYPNIILTNRLQPPAIARRARGRFLLELFFGAALDVTVAVGLARLIGGLVIVEIFVGFRADVLRLQRTPLVVRRAPADNERHEEGAQLHKYEMFPK